MNNEIVKDALLKGHYVTPEDIDAASAYSKKHDAPISEYLFNEELISSDTLGQALAEYLGEAFVNLSANPPTRITVFKIPRDIAEKNRVVLIAENMLDIVAASDLLDTNLRKDAVTALEALFPGKKITINYALPEDLRGILNLYHAALQTRFSDIIKKEKRVAPEIVNQIIADALALRASDVHLEPQENEVIVRFRIDGVLEEAGTLPTQYYENIVNNIKVQAGLRIDEHASSQDGAIRFKGTDAASKADLRVSIIPTLSGEKIVMRVLAEYLKDLSLSDLGILPAYQRKLTEYANRPYGMILTVGPTGSGKTTTLYAVLKLLNEKSVNITTIEDPVEYRIPRVNQVQVNSATKLSFANGLRTIVRQDPDIILVGEIRDLETADMAVNASLTGHLLLSTFHSNDAATVMPRLIDMKVEPFLLASTLMVIIAQRLVRKICSGCKVSEAISEIDLAKLYPKAAPFIKGKGIRIYKGKGCSKCNGTGYKGQLGIFEFIEITSEMQELILSHPTSTQIYKLARKQGTASLFEDGLEKAAEGFTTIDEVLRVALPPEM